jgi:Putative prokaryotic signal transducing protein
MEHSMEEFVAVSTVQGQFVEEQMRAFLEANGIPTRVRGETLRTTHGISVDGLGSVEILVPRERLDEARALLAHAEHGDFALAADEDPEGSG